MVKYKLQRNECTALMLASENKHSDVVNRLREFCGNQIREEIENSGLLNIVVLIQLIIDFTILICSYIDTLSELMLYY